MKSAETSFGSHSSRGRREHLRHLHGEEGLPGELGNKQLESLLRKHHDYRKNAEAIAKNEIHKIFWSYCFRKVKHIHENFYCQKTLLSNWSYSMVDANISFVLQSESILTPLNFVFFFTLIHSTIHQLVYNSFHIVIINGR